MLDAETSNSIERIGHNINATWKSAEQQPDLVHIITKARANLAFGIGMQHQIDIQRLKREDIEVLEYVKAEDPELFKTLKKAAKNKLKKPA